MKKPGKPAGGRKRHLSDEDEALWEHTARSTEPLKRSKSRVHTAAEALERALLADAADVKRQTLPDAVRPAPSQPPPPNYASRNTSVAAKAPPLSDFDKRKAKKLGAGQISIDARIDLHGFRQSEAHTALRRFLFQAYSQGHRWVLIITGKGARKSPDREIEPWNMTSVEPGVLKRRVPEWLTEPELRAIVVSYKTAAARHGGEGALYVHLRNPDRAGR